MVSKRVDLVLQGHDHTYQRSKQLRLTPGCPAVPTHRGSASCIVDSGATGRYAAGAGTVLVIDGSGGQARYPINPGDAETGYFARRMGRNIGNTAGFTRFAVTPTALTASYVPVSGGSFADGFTIAKPDTVAPSAPVGLTARAEGASIITSWQPAGDDVAVAGYRLFRDGVLISAMGPRTTTLSTPGWGSGSLTFTVRAFDAAGNVSPTSNAVTVTLP